MAKKNGSKWLRRVVFGIFLGLEIFLGFSLTQISNQSHLFLKKTPMFFLVAVNNTGYFKYFFDQNTR
jgi:hypothetical protein